MIKEIRSSLIYLGFSKNDIKVYIALMQLGEAVPSVVAKKINMPRTTVISILNKLQNDNYITCRKYKGKIYYWIESPSVISNIFKQKIDVAEQLSNLLTDVYRSESHFPYGAIYDTKTGIIKFIEEVVASLKNKSIIYTIDSPQEGNYSKIYNQSIENVLLSQKNKKNILTHSLIPHDSFKKVANFKIEVQNIKIREMPKDIIFKSSLWIIEDRLVHFSGNPPFVTSIKHEAIVPSIKSVYDYLWSISKDIN